MVVHPTAPVSSAAGPGKGFLVVGSLVAAGLGGFYASLLNSKRKQEEAGTNPHHEQLLAAYGRPVPEDRSLTSVGHGRYGDKPPAFRMDAASQRNGHTTRDSYKNTPEYQEHGETLLYMSPPPQRGKKDGSGQAYTKSSDYVDSYEKVKRGRKDNRDDA